ncbi:hypothetical protein BD324DRAFT_635076 [Kockovaella imperatae]|uniref:Zn(2)-C6 fungal-type domain-containing protein n=1 Tax=Kockovaella imperatae TaxID=4999 RepID=A0A1Y1U9T5_9TREE|nr:hypothetical protein BD324DRAFT_635076 [Kockovaella imperatae]ORX34801.1 hypothetical protein BD324DRAFT_635076 [Kockovaella imperatae]
MTKACDACYIRRTKCSGSQPCRCCTISDLNCTYERRHKKRGPQGKNVAQIRATLGSGASSSPSTSPSNSTEPSRLLQQAASSEQPSLLDWNEDTFLFEPATALVSDIFTVLPGGEGLDGGLFQIEPHHPPIPSFASSTSLSDPSIIQPQHAGASQLLLLEDYLSNALQRFLIHIFPLYPVIDAEEVQKRFVDQVHLHDKQFAALVLSISALAALLPAADMAKTLAARNKANSLVDMAIGLHNTADLGDRPTLDCITTSMMLSSSALILKGPTVAYIRHREAISLAEVLNLTEPQAYENFDEPNKERALRIYWALAIAERSNSLIMSRPITFRSALTCLPLGFPIQSGLSLALRPTARLYELMEPSLIDCIIGKCYPQTCGLSTQLALSAHRSLADVSVEGCVSEVQVADTLLSAQWMHVKIWQACVTHSLLNFRASQPELRIEYPIDCLSATVAATQKISRRAICGNGHVMGLKLKVIAEAAEATLKLPEPPKLSAQFSSVDMVERSILTLKCLATEVASLQWFRWHESSAIPS